MATSIKKVEKPVTMILRHFPQNRLGLTSLIVFFFVKKCEIIPAKVMPAPAAVASPAPMIPMPNTNTNK